eukprot:CAMPEP_0196745148 /NCGR_PEP_ID=MMETSP1091-20130531/60325_1 /TAXON_ID=302021 /ORGANISM="Rhodomonas sp., Strain CCMP768" /LENGTH=68 /DNA_ID=CAMNT_0042091849 /DNA_START=87 /DNA_END=293 /DNA_ORIENTATION=-
MFRLGLLHTLRFLAHEHGVSNHPHRIHVGAVAGGNGPASGQVELEKVSRTRDARAEALLEPSPRLSVL